MKTYTVYMLCNLTCFENRNWLQETYNLTDKGSWAFYPSEATLFTKDEAEKLAKEVEEAFAEYECFVDVANINEFIGE